MKKIYSKLLRAVLRANSKTLDPVQNSINEKVAASIQKWIEDKGYCKPDQSIADVAAVMGVSQGGMIAQYFAADYPDMTEALILAVTAPYANETAKERVERWLELTEQGDHKGLMIDTAEHSYSEAYLRRYRKAYPLLGAVGRPKSYERFLANARAILAFDARDVLDKIACPTLILGGEEDRIVGAEASRELHRAIAPSELFLYPGLGHAAYEEAKDFSARVYRFLEGCIWR